jgi:Mg/Co/Ni transporter MgtE
MNPDFVSVGRDTTVGEALARVRVSELGDQQVSTICVVDERGKLVGSPSLAQLIRADDGQTMSSLSDGACPAVAVEADVPEVARVMSDYNLVAIPVLDDDGAPAGIIAVDDVLELLIPEEWRWRAGAARD